MKSTRKSFVMLRRLHGRIYDWWKKKERLHDLVKKIERIDKDTFILAYTPSHGNLGDQAIAVAETTMLEQNNIHFTEICDNDIRLLIDNNKLNMLNGHKLLLHGGGYLGTLWPSAERDTRTLIISCPESKFLFFPNTVYYDDDNEMNLDDSVRIINSNPEIVVCTREITSYELVVNRFNHVRLIPDMVLSLNPISDELIRSGCLVCLRNDVEKTMTVAMRDEIINTVESMFENQVTKTDMVLKHNVSSSDRMTELKKKFDQFQRSELVITDRLHGMIFAAITGTPCVVFNSKSPKVRGCYEWIKNLEYIRFVDDPGEIKEFYNRVKGREYHYENSHLKPYFEELVSIIRKMKEE